MDYFNSEAIPKSQKIKQIVFSSTSITATKGRPLILFHCERFEVISSNQCPVMDL